MGRVKAFRIPGCRCWFFTGDHGPAHFHAGAADAWEVRVFFLLEPVEHEVKFETRKIPGAVLKRIVTAAGDHRAELLAEWERHRADDP